MDRKHPLLSHQYEAACALAEKFEHVTVITGNVGDVNQHSHIRIISTNWVPGKKITNLLRLYLSSIPLIIKGDFCSVFFHMTDLQCAVLSPLIRIRGRRQYLWYAHAFKSPYLTFASYWVNQIVTSTYGSCPLPASLVTPIGQAIDENRFKLLPAGTFDLQKIVSIGRFDKSKNIDLLISSCRELRQFFPDLSLTIIGSPANQESKRWSEALVADSYDDVRAGWLNFQDSISREAFPREIAKQGCFFHAYVGSLDKTLIESTMLGIPVVSINPEYLAIFGSWSGAKEINLVDEYLAMRRIPPMQLELEIARRYDIARRQHSLTHWIFELASILG